jgi:TonB-linked SusC/RagA family outer membrane protein
MYLSALCKSPLRDYRKPLNYRGVTKTQLRSNKTILLAMKLTAILVLTACLQVSAKTYSQTITLNVQNAPIDKVVKEIERQTKVNFFYEEGLFQNAKPVTVSVSKGTLQQTLEACFRGQPFEYKIVQNTVFVKRKEVVNIGQTQANKVDNGDLKGRVLTKEGEPLVSANVVNKRTGKGTTTDANGNFVLHDVNRDDIVLITYTGYAPRSIKVSEFATVTFVLETANNELDQVVMQAYGQTTQRFNTGNIAKVTAEEISKQPVINPLQALQGRVPGLVITQTSGYGSAPFKVELRGRNNLNPLFTSDPLYIIDGVPLTISEVAGSSSYNSGSAGFLQNGMLNPAGGQSPLFSINPSNIESIEVLKDADGTAIYGSRGANGVILITTKRGKPGKAKFTANLSQGITAITRYWDMLNTNQYVQMRKEAFQNDGLNPSSDPYANYPDWYAPDITIWDTTRFTDWQKKIWGNTGKVTEANVALSGGNTQSSFWVSSGYSRRTDITSVSGSDQRLSMSLGVAFHSLNQKFNMSFSNNYSFSQSNMIFINNVNYALLPPNSPDILDSAGKPNFAEWRTSSYPFSSLFQPYTSKTNFINTSLNLSYQLLKGLQLRSNFGYNSAFVKQTQFIPISSQDPTYSPTGQANFGNNENKNWIIEPQLEYNAFLAKGKLTVLVGSTIQHTTTDGQNIQGFNYTSDLLLRSISNAPTKTANEYFGEYRYSAIFGRINYNWRNKYLLNISGRRDGSSRFGPDKQFANYGAIGAAWVFTEESFIKQNLRFLSFGKIRGSYGTTGSDAIGDYKYLTRWSSFNTQPYGGVSSLVPLQHFNDKYHWPTNKKIEGAVDLGIFNERISLSVAWYRNRCNDQLVQFPLAIYTGFSTVVANSPADVENKGWEVTLNAKVIEANNFSWSFTFNTGRNKNKLLAYPNLSLSPYKDLFVVGQPLNIVKALHYTGVDSQTGLFDYEDKNKDGNISTASDSTDDRYVIDITPKFTGGLGSNFKYKGFELNLFFSIVKQKGINALGSSVTLFGSDNNTSLWLFDNRWQKPGDIKSAPKFTINPDPSYQYFAQSDGVYTDASFIRLSNLSLGYNLPEKLVHKAKLQGVQIRFSAQNLFVITKYKGVDPESQNFGGMPPTKVVTGGINFNF